MENSTIAWTHDTFNPWIGCTKVSPGCINCYAKTFDDRHQRGPESHWGPGAPRYTTSDGNWKQPAKWERSAVAQGIRKRVFCASLADWADDEAPKGARVRLWDTIRSTPHLDWLLLTKRAKNIQTCLPKDWADGYSNVWLGVSCEDKKYGYPRVDILRTIPAVKRFLSCEPLLEDISDIDLTGIDWVITGGESGRGKGVRDYDIAWARSLQSAAVKAGAKFFLKQLGSHPVEDGSPFRILDSHGANLESFPSDLRVQEVPDSFPAARTQRVTVITTKTAQSEDVSDDSLTEVIEWLERRVTQDDGASKYLAQAALSALVGLVEFPEAAAVGGA